MESESKLNDREPARREREIPRRADFRCLWANMWSGDARSGKETEICAENEAVQQIINNLQGESLRAPNLR